MKLVLSFLCLTLVTGYSAQALSAETASQYEETYGEWNWATKPSSPCANGLCPLQGGSSY